MTSKPGKTTHSRRAVILLPVAFLIHLAEEWLGGLPEWTLLALGNEISHERFLIINSIAFVIFVIGTLAVLQYPRLAWLGGSFAALFGLNGVLHGLATLVLGSYSPGTITGLILYLPLSFIILRYSSARLSQTTFTFSILLGVLLHGLVSFLAFL